MEFEREKNSQEIIFNNEPKLSGHEVDKELDKKRSELVPIIKEFISTHDRFKDKKIAITFSETGVSSLISIIETPDEKLVLKIPLDARREGEAQFLRAWDELGVVVPKILEDGILGGHRYILMDHIDAETLREGNTYSKLVENETFTEMGQTLRMMHTPESEGYGRIIDGKPEYTSFKDWLENDYIADKIRYVQENRILSDEHGHIPAAMETLAVDIGNKMKSTYCHYDFAVYNIFDTEPLTVFDPDPTLNDGYIDLGRSIAIAVGHGNLAEAGTQLTKGYFNEDHYNKKTLQSSILLNSYLKIARWHKTKSAKHIRNLQRYLIETRHLL